MQEQQRRQQEAAQRQYDQQLTRQALGMHDQIAGQRTQWMDGIKRNDPNHRVEQVGNAQTLRDGQGRIRDVEYKSGDVRFRSFEYDQNGQVRQMIVDSKSKGVQIWNKGPDGSFRDQFGRQFRGSMNVDQTGNFTYQDQTGAHTYSVNGRWDNQRPNGPYQGGDRPTDKPNSPYPNPGDRQTPQRDGNVERMYSQFYGPQQITDKRNYRDNLWDAAATQKPVVMTFYRSGEPGAKEALDAVARARQAQGDKAVYMAVDLDKVDANSPIGQYARNYIGDRSKFQTPMTMVFTQSQGQNERVPVQPDKPMFHQGGQVDAAKLGQAIDAASRVQRERVIRVPHRDGHPDSPTDNPNPGPNRPGPRPEDMLVQLSKPGNQTPIDRAEEAYRMMNGMQPKDKVSLVRDTCRMADSALVEAAKKQQDLEKAKRENKPGFNEQELTATKQQVDQLKELSLRSHTLMGRTLVPEVMNNNFNVPAMKDVMSGMNGAERCTFMIDAANYGDAMANANRAQAPVAGKCKAMVGLMSAELGKDYVRRAQTEPANAQKFLNQAGECFVKGLEYTMAAGTYDKSLYSNQAFRTALLGAGIPGRGAEFVLAKGAGTGPGQETPNWFAATPADLQAAGNNADMAGKIAYERAKQEVINAMRAQPADVKPQPEVKPSQPEVKPQPKPAVKPAEVKPTIPQPKPEAKPGDPSDPYDWDGAPPVDVKPQPKPPAPGPRPHGVRA